MTALTGPEPLIREAERRSASGDLPGAIALYQRALEIAPALPDSWFNLGVLHRRSGNFHAALAAYDQALRHGIARPEEVHLNRAVILTDGLHLDAAAEQELARALELNPGYEAALLNLANLRTDHGDRAGARQLYERILAQNPEAHEALARYAYLSFEPATADPLIARLRSALDRAATLPAAQASLGFALAHILDRAGRYREAFRAARDANQAARMSVPGFRGYGRREFEQLVDAVIADSSRPSHTLAAPLPPRPVFVCGVYRSGTTLTEHLLGADRRVATGGELHLAEHLAGRMGLAPAGTSLASSEQLRSFQSAYQEGIRQAFPGCEFVTDKTPTNGLYLRLLKSAFPAARVVYTTRDDLDTALSIYFLQFDARISYSFELTDIAHYLVQYRKLMRHWQRVYPDEVFELNYDRLVAEPEATARALFSFCGLAWDPMHLNFASRPSRIKTASTWQVRENLYQRSSGRWRNYLPELGPVREMLAQENG